MDQKEKMLTGEAEQEECGKAPSVEAEKMDEDELDGVAGGTISHDDFTVEKPTLPTIKRRW